jgi:uncharacterized protein
MSERPLTVGQWLALLPIELYRRLLAPLKPVPSCRFHPTCSSYAAQAVLEHGALHGVYLAIRRILRCHPYHPGGFDPVPPRRTTHSGPHRTGAVTEEP